MSDAAAVLLALATACGAWAARPVPIVLPLVLVAVALVFRWPVVLCIGAALLASTLAARSWHGLHPPASGPWSGTVTLAGDPVDMGPAVRVDVRIDGKRVEAWARGASASRLRPRLAGERVGISGRLSVVPSRERTWLARRHVGARMSVMRVGRWAPGGAVARLANALRRTLVGGATSLPPTTRSLFAGFVLGDDRGQPPEVVDDFRGAGLTHLLVVSGENVAFLLALCHPVLSRLGLRTRFVTGLLVLALFGAVTRWEPSVLRAEAMAALAMTATLAGRPQTALRLLALAVTGLLLVDPLLLGSVGFLLSVAACTGIVLLARPIAGALPGPRSLATAVGVTVAAQAGVAPVLVPVFGRLPVATLPANLLAVPAAGPVMAWGMAAGIPAGLAGGPVASLAHLPTRVLVAWVAGVARWSSALPLGTLGGAQVLALGALGALAMAVTAHRARVLALAAALVVVAAPALGPQRSLSGAELCPHARVWRGATGTRLEVGAADPVRLLAALRRERIRHIDVVVVRGRTGAARDAIAPLLRRNRVGRVVALEGGP